MKNVLRNVYILVWMYSMCTIVSCQTMSPSNQSSGLPHVLLENTSSSIVMNTIVSSMNNSGFKVISTKDSTVVVTRPSGPELAADVFGASFSGTAEIRIAYTITRSGSAVQVSADISLVANPGTSYEKSASLNDTKYARSMQASLETLKSAVHPAGHAAGQPQTSSEPSQRPSLQQQSGGDSQLAAYMSDIRSRGRCFSKSACRRRFV